MDVVGLRTIATLREQGVSFHELRKVREFLAAQTNEDWANRQFYVVGKRVFFTNDDAVIATRPLGQQVNPSILDLGPIVNDVKAAVGQLQHRPPDQIGRIARDRLIMGGVPILAGTRIPTATIDWFHRHGYDVDAILEEFPRLKPDDVWASIAFERTQRREAPDSARAVG